MPHVWGWFIPSVPGRRQMSENRVPLRIRAGQWRMARPDCGSELWPQLQKTSHLQEFKEWGITATHFNIFFFTNESRHSGSCLWLFHSEVLTHPHAARTWQITRRGSQWLKWMMSPSPVSPQTGRYSSCWMSSMSSSPLPIPPLVVMRGGRPSSPELKV